MYQLKYVPPLAPTERQSLGHLYYGDLVVLLDGPFADHIILRGYEHLVSLTDPKKAWRLSEFCNFTWKFRSLRPGESVEMTVNNSENSVIYFKEAASALEINWANLDKIMKQYSNY